MKWLSLLMLLILPILGRAQFTYTTNVDNTLTITGYGGSNGVVLIPTTIGGLPVTSIGEYAFAETSVAKLLIPDTVTEIGEGAFYDCESLTSITIGNSVTNLADDAFELCTRLGSVSFRGNAPGSVGQGVFLDAPTTVYFLPGATGWGPMFDGQTAISWIQSVPYIYSTNRDGITLAITGYAGSAGDVSIPSSINFLPVSNIGDWAFYATSVTNVLIPDTVTDIGDGAFFDCESLTNLILGNSVTNIGDWTFGFCPNLASVNCRGNAPALGGANVLYGNLATFYYLPGGSGWGPTLGGHPAILSNPPITFNYSTNSDGITLTITGEIGSDGEMAIPSSIGFFPVTSIGDDAFDSADMTNVIIPTSVVNIEDAAFVSCFGLTNVIIPNSVTNIGTEAFYLCNSLTSVAIPDSVLNIGDAAFGSCTSLTNIIIGSGVNSIGVAPFDGCSGLAAITVDTNNLFLKSVDGVLFSRDKTVLVEYPDGRAGSYAVPTGVAEIGDNAFSFCGLVTDVSIPEGVTNIGYNAFYGSSLTSVTVADTVLSFGSGAFAACGNLGSITILGGPALAGVGAFADCYSLTNVTLANGVPGIGDSSFHGCDSLTSITIPASVTNIGQFAFEGCHSLTKLSLPNGVVNIGNFAFAQCSGLVDLTIPGSVTNVGDQAFYYCNGLVGVTISNSVTSIGDGAFQNCFNLTNVALGANITSIGNDAFEHCASLTGLNIPSSVTNIGNWAFAYCVSLTSITIPNSINDLEDYAFIGCASLASVYFDGNPPSIESTSFSFANPNLTAYYLPGTTGWGNFSLLTGVPAMPWLPQMQTTGTAYSKNAFAFTINWASGQTVVVEACTNLANPVWRPVQTNTLTTGTASFSDPQWTNYPARFYRLRSP